MTSRTDLGALFDASDLDDATLKTLKDATGDLGDTIAAALGDVDPAVISDMEGKEVFLVSLLVDDSSSIAWGDNTDNIIVGVNAVIDSLDDSKARGVTLITCRLLNGGVLFPLVPLAQAQRLTRSNYRPAGITPLYDQAMAVLATVVAKAAELEQAGIAVRSATYFVSDGKDEGSSKRARDIAPIIAGLLGQEVHIVGAMGIEDGSTDFRAVFTSMGVPEGAILVPQSTPTAIRQAFGTVSRSLVRASQTAAGANFSQLALGGFGGTN